MLYELPKKDDTDKDKDEKDKDKDGKKEVKVTRIDIDGFENRVELLDVEFGNLGNLTAVEGKLIFVRSPNSGSANGGSSSIDYYDFKEREVKTILNKASNYQVSANGKKLLIRQGRKLSVIDIKADQKIDKSVPTEDMDNAYCTSRRVETNI